MKKVLSLALAVLLIASVIVSVPITASAFNVDNYKANITKISIGAPITGTDGKKYLPATVYFTANENLGDSNAVSFLEGYLKGMLANEDKFNGISGLGMTLMGPLKPDALEGMGSNAYSWQWSEGYGEGILKYNIPLKEDGDTQTIEQSLATGQQEVNCVDKDDKISFSIETVMNTDSFPPDVLPEGGSLFSDERTITIEDITKYPKTVEFGNTCTITVHYVYADGSQAAPDVVETYEIGFINYMIESPTIEGYTPDRIGVTGLPSGNKEETVTYTKNADNPVIEPAPESKDISLNEASWTKGTGEDAEVVLKGILKGKGWTIGDAYAKLGGALSTSDCDGIQTGQEGVDTTIKDNGDGTSSFTFGSKLYWLGGKLPDSASKMTLMISFWKEGKEYVSNQLIVGLGETAKKGTEALKTAIKVSAKKTKIYVGGKTIVTAEVTNGSGTTTFTTSDKTVATVDKNGKVTGKGKGTAVITAKNNGVKKNIKITVIRKTNTVVASVKKLSVKYNTKKVFKKVITVKDAKGKIVFKKKSGNSHIKVNSKKGTITVKKGLAKGTYKVKVKVTDKGNTKYNSASKTITIKITVK